MDSIISKVLLAMMQKNMGDTRRIEHTLKVFAYAQQLGITEKLDHDRLEILKLTALLHDIGIQAAEKKYGISNSRLQELEGPIVAHEILTSIDVSPEKIERICYVISKHHTFSAVNGEDFQLLVEADFLVNATEDHLSDYQIMHFAKNVFKSQTGLQMLKLLFPSVPL